jgi:ubiquitin carboxyl-terminal hydrolase L5
LRSPNASSNAAALAEIPTQELVGELSGLLITLTTIKEKVAAETNKLSMWRVCALLPPLMRQRENVRRKHNYVPFIVNFLKILAEKGELDALIRRAQVSKGSQPQ